MTPSERALLRAAADAAGLPDGPLGDIHNLPATQSEVRLARDLAVCLLDYHGLNVYRITNLVPEHRGPRRMASTRKPPIHLLLQIYEYAERIIHGEEIMDDEVEVLQIHTLNWSESRS
jgi:hypothetical protein